MFFWYICIVMCVAVSEGRQRIVFGRGRWQQAVTEGPRCAGHSPRLWDRVLPYKITTSTDFNLVPRNLTNAHVIFSANHRVQFGRMTFPHELGGPQLVHLRVSVRYIRRIPPGVFANLVKLRSLKLYHNAPKSQRFSMRLSDGAFEGLSEVVELVLAQLGIEDLPAGVFRDLRSICRLDLTGNHLDVIRSGVFEPLPASFPGDSKENYCCRNLTMLSLGRNRFVDVADINLTSLTSLLDVDLYGNAITRLSRDSFNGRSNSTSGGFANVQKLNLGLNNISHIETGLFERLVRLRELYLDGNMLSNVSASAFVGLPVVRMDLSNNYMTELRAGVFAPLTSLTELWLADNAMEIIHTGAFFGLGKLQGLDMSYNRLHRLDDETFYGLAELEELHVRRSQLVEVSPLTLAPVASALTVLDLAENRLKTIDYHSLAKVDRLIDVDLQGNPWTCDCRLYRSDYVGSQSLKAEWDNIVCEFPPAAREKLLSSVLGEDSTCEPPTEQPTAGPPLFDRWTLTMMVIAVLLVLCVVITCGLVASIRRIRRSAVWAPCHDEEEGCGSSETSSSDDDCRKTDEVA